MLIRAFKSKDEIEILQMYKVAFAGFPWLENLSLEILQERFNKDKQRPGFNCIVAEENEKIIGACWWDETSPTLIKEERGEQLASFCLSNCGSEGIIWCRDTIVYPQHQKQGIATKLKAQAFQLMKNSGKRFVFTRFRDDNTPIIQVNQKFGMGPTGIKTIITVVGGGQTTGEYWYLNLDHLQAIALDALLADKVYWNCG